MIAGMKWEYRNITITGRCNGVFAFNNCRLLRMFALHTIVDSALTQVVELQRSDLTTSGTYSVLLQRKGIYSLSLQELLDAFFNNLLDGLLVILLRNSNSCV